VSVCSVINLNVGDKKDACGFDWISDRPPRSSSAMLGFKRLFDDSVGGHSRRSASPYPLSCANECQAIHRKNRLRKRISSTSSEIAAIPSITHQNVVSFPSCTPGTPTTFMPKMPAIRLGGSSMAVKRDRM